MLPPRGDPDRIAYYEAAGWRAYYERKYLKLLRLTAAMAREQFGIPFPLSWIAAYWIARGAAGWAPLDHNMARVRPYFERFYRLAGWHSRLRFDPAEIATLELDYWDVHRRLARSPAEDRQPLVDVLTDLHARLFGLTPEQARPSAEWRAAAAETVDGITGGRSTDVQADWYKLEDQLRSCYRCLAEEGRNSAPKTGGSASSSP